MRRHLSAFLLSALVLALLAVIPANASEGIPRPEDIIASQADSTLQLEPLPIADETTNAGCSVAIEEVAYGGAPLLVAHVAGRGWAQATTDEIVRGYLSAMGSSWQLIPGTTTGAGSTDWICPGLDSGGGYTAASISWSGDVAVAIFRNDPHRDLVGFLTPVGQRSYSRNVAADDAGRVSVATEDGEGFVVHESNGDGTWGRAWIPVPGSPPQGGADQELRLAASDGVVAVTRIGSGVWLVQLILDKAEGYEIEELTLPADASTNRFGYAVDVDSGVVVVGAPGDPTDAGNSGSVYVFERAGSSWDVVRLRPSGEADYRAFGSSVAISGGRIVVGAPGPGNSLDYGGVFLFDFDGTTWSEVVLDLADGVTSDGRFGAAVDLAGDTALVGQPGWSRVYSAALPDRGSFIDDDLSVFQTDIEWLAAAGITKGCNPPANTMFCPGDPVTRGQMAAFLVRALGLTDDGGGNTFVDDDGSVFETDIAELAAAGITRGCNPPVNDMFCPDDPVSRGQMAAFLVRALRYTDDGGGDLFVDDDDSIFETDIDRLATAGVTRGCNPPNNDMFCPTSVVTRGQMAAFLHRALG